MQSSDASGDSGVNKDEYVFKVAENI